MTLVEDASESHNEGTAAPEGAAHIVDGTNAEASKATDAASASTQDADREVEATASASNEEGAEAKVYPPAKVSESELLVTQLDSGAPETTESQVTEITDASTQEANGAPDKTMDHLPEPPASPTSNTAFSGTTSTPPNSDLPAKPAVVTKKAPSANRVSISYAGGSRRLLIDAEIVEKLILFRTEGRAEIEINVERADDGFKGILVFLLFQSYEISSLIWYIHAD